MWFRSALIGFVSLFWLRGSSGSDCKVIPLSNRNWKAFSEQGNKFLPMVKIPGGIYSDCIRNGEIRDYLFYGKNDLNTRWVSKYRWEYVTDFELTSEDIQSPYIEMVFHGIDTVAEIYVNNKRIGYCNNMFMRYSFDVKRHVNEGSNHLIVALKSPIEEADQLAKKSPYAILPKCHPSAYHGECHINMLRKMQASFGWDWGPAIPSLGIWKPVDLVLSSFPAKLESIGVYIDENKSTDSDWILKVSAWFDLLGGSKAADPVHGWIKVGLNVENGETVSTDVPFVIRRNKTQPAEAGIVFKVPKKSVQLWWPRGYGKQHLYTLHVAVRRSFGDPSPGQRKHIRIGFRTVKLVENEILPGNSSTGRTFYLEVNGVPIFAKGSNWIPLDILPEKSASEVKMKHLLMSAYDANFNMIRVWGGGFYESDKFYKMCDSLGIMVWQDMMFACSMYPSTAEFLKSVRKEVRQQIQRLQHHPSLMVYSANNENEAALRQNWYGTKSKFDTYKSDYVKLYVENIEPVFKRFDPSRPFTLSSPSNGIESIQEGYVAENPQNTLFGDVHYYNYLSNGWDWKIFPVPRFSSEYGIQSLPSYWVLKQVLDEKELHWDSDGLLWRQHSPEGFMYMKKEIEHNLPWSSNLTDIVYLSQINQAMWMKTETEHYRRFKSVIDDANQGKTMGALYWQLNDVWEASTWSSIDYRGNWKMLHYFAKKFFSDIIVVTAQTADDRLLVWIVSDVQAKVNSRLITRVHQWDKFDSFIVRQDQVTLEALQSAEVYQETVKSLLVGRKMADSFFSFELETEGVPVNHFFPTNLLTAKYLDANVTIASRQLLEDKMTVVIELHAERPALFVWLESREQPFGVRFTDNGFHMTTPVLTVNFTATAPLTKKVVDSIYVTYLKKSY